MIQQLWKFSTINNIVTKRCLSVSLSLRTTLNRTKNLNFQAIHSPTPFFVWNIPSQLPQQQHHHPHSTLSRSSFSTTVTPTSTDTEKEPLLGVGKYKTSTGLVGLAVEPDWYNVMLKKFQALLDKMEASDMPETAQYRIDVTKWCNYVIAQVKANPEDPEAVEDAVRMGQVEELIELADDEMLCLDTYLRVRMWELVAAANPPIIDLNPDPMRDPFGSDGNPAEQDAIRKGMEQPQK